MGAKEAVFKKSAVCVEEEEEEEENFWGVT